MTTVSIYYASICGLCTKAIDFLREKGITFTAYAVEWDEATGAFKDGANTREMYRRCGEQVDFVPQIFVGNKHIKGWRELKPMIESGAIQHLLPEPE